MTQAHSHIVFGQPTVNELSSLVITYVVGAAGTLIPLSFYSDMIWDYRPYFPNAARGRHEKEIDWAKTPEEWRPSLRSAAAAFTKHKVPGGVQLDPGTIPKRHVTLNAFAKWCSSSGIKAFRDVRAFDLARYLHRLRENGLEDQSIASHVAILRKVYEMRMYMADSFTAEAMAALGRAEVGSLWDSEKAKQRRTELIPMEEAAQLFSAALDHLDRVDDLLRLRDELDANWLEASKHMSRKSWGDKVKAPWLAQAGFRDAYEFESAVADIRTASYIVLAMSTGCRVHELGDIRIGCLYPEVIDDETYWWLKSSTRKTGDGPMKWLAPDIAVKAVGALEWESEPLRQRVAVELSLARSRLSQPMSEREHAALAVEMKELERNVNRLFLSESDKGIQSTDTKCHNKQLAAFAARKGVVLSSSLATHRFRRTYVVFLIHFNKGARVDLLTMQHHLKHSSVLMTEWYASLSDTDKELFEMIEEESDYFDADLVEHWMDTTTSLAGGLGKRIKDYPGKYHTPVFFSSRRDFVSSIRDGLNIRSTGHSWCVSEAQDCGGRGLFEAPMCGDCNSGVIDESFGAVWRNLRVQNTELAEMADIGPGGREIAKKALAAADKVLSQLLTSDWETSHG